MPSSAEDKVLAERIENDFTYHPPQGSQAARYQELRDAGKSLALKVTQLCPNGRERSTALTKLEEAIMWANAGIARHGDSDS